MTCSLCCLNTLNIIDRTLRKSWYSKLEFWITIFSYKKILINTPGLTLYWYLFSTWIRNIQTSYFIPPHWIFNPTFIICYYIIIYGYYTFVRIIIDKQNQKFQYIPRRCKDVSVIKWQKIKISFKIIFVFD